VAYGEGAEERVAAAAPGGIDAFIDAGGHGSVDLALALGIAPARTNTIIDFEAAQRVGVSTQGSHQVGTAGHLAEQAALVATGQIEVPIAATFPLDQVQAAYEQLAGGHARGKLVFQISTAGAA
jgi:NADPH:quinone reductase-like Zn-dependent oxidoreductase